MGVGMPAGCGIMAAMKTWKTLSRKTILDHSQYLQVEEHEVQLPDGRVIPDWPWVITPNYINAVVVTAEGQFLMFRQTKYGLEGTSLAPVGGHIEPNEDPLLAAQRETLEETGYKADDWVHLGTFQENGNRGVATGHLYLARNARRVAEPDADDLEEMELLYLNQAEVETALAAGEFKVLAWGTVVALALLHLNREAVKAA